MYILSVDGYYKISIHNLLSLIQPNDWSYYILPVSGEGSLWGKKKEIKQLKRDNRPQMESCAWSNAFFASTFFPAPLPP